MKLDAVLIWNWHASNEILSYMECQDHMCLTWQFRSQKFYCLDLCMGESHEVTDVGPSISECCVTQEDLYECYRVTEGDKIRQDAVNTDGKSRTL